MSYLSVLFDQDDGLETGAWCDRCALPSAIVQSVVFRTYVDGVSLGETRARLSVCTDCGEVRGLCPS